MMFFPTPSIYSLIDSELHDESTFYTKFTQDLLHAEREVVVESPFITRDRMRVLFPIFETLINRRVKIYIFTRDPREHTKTLEVQSEVVIQRLEALGVQVFLCLGNHHRKLAIVDREILWEGSLNILSQAKSREIMRRIDSKELADQMFSFLKFERFI